MLINERFERLQDHGCVACSKLGIIRQAEIHHLVEGYRLGHDHTIPLCPWHHRGEPLCIDTTKKRTFEKLGPNLRDQKKAFIEAFGSERELLGEINSWLENDQEIKALGVNGSSLPF